MALLYLSNTSLQYSKIFRQDLTNNTNKVQVNKYLLIYCPRVVSACMSHDNLYTTVLPAEIKIKQLVTCEVRTVGDLSSAYTEFGIESLVTLHL